MFMWVQKWVREHEVESETVMGEPEDGSGEKKICDHTQNLGRIFFLSEKNTEWWAWSQDSHMLLFFASTYTDVQAWKHTHKYASNKKWNNTPYFLT